MFSLLLEVPESEQDAVVALLWESGIAGILEEQSGRLRAFFDSAEAAAAVSERLIGMLLEMRREDDGSTYRTDPEDFEPILIGNRFALMSAHSARPVPSGRIAIRADAQHAFGSGRHQTTQLMMQALEQHLGPDSVVLDVGCGSGILSLAARELGAKRVFACDVDLNAIDVSRRPGVLLFAGSADAAASACADLVLANITAVILDRLAVELHRVTKPDGRIIISGFTRDHLPERFHAETVVKGDEWECWICRRDETLASGNSEPMIHSREWW